jgi:hypothetical protein
MSEQELRNQIDILKEKLRNEKLAWNEKLQESEKINFNLRQEFNQKRVGLENEIIGLKDELLRLRQNKEIEIAKHSEEFESKIKELERKIEEHIYEKDQIIQKSKLKAQYEKELSDKKSSELGKSNSELNKSVAEYKNLNKSLENQLQDKTSLYEHELSVLKTNFEKEKIIIEEEYNYKLQSYEDNIERLENKITALNSEVEEKERILERAENIREAENSALRLEKEQKVTHLKNILDEVTRQRDTNIQELNRIKERLNSELQQQHEENEFLHSKLALREEELAEELHNKNDTIQSLNNEINQINHKNNEYLGEIELNREKERAAYLKEIESLKVAIDRLNKECASTKELRDIEGNNWRLKLEELEREYQYETAKRDVLEEEKEEGYLSQINQQQFQIEEAVKNIDELKEEGRVLADEYKKRLADKQDEIDTLYRDLETLKAKKDDQLQRKEAEYKRYEEDITERIESVKGRLTEDNKALQEKLNSLEQEKHKLELEKSKTIESLMEQLKARENEFDHLKRSTIEREAEWNKRLLEVRHEKDIFEEEKNKKEEELEKLRSKLQQEIREMAQQMEKKRDHWEWLVSRKQQEIDDIKRESQEEIIRLKEEYSVKRQQLEASRSGMENAIKELSDKMEKDREGKYRELKEKDDRIRRLEKEYEAKQLELQIRYEGQSHEMADRKEDLERNIRELEYKLKNQRAVWEEHLAVKERELDATRQRIKDREEELYAMWAEKSKAFNQKTIELTRQVEELETQQKQRSRDLENELEGQKQKNWEGRLESIRKEKEVEVEYQQRLGELQTLKDKLENELSVLREQLNTERINAFRNLREKEEEVNGIRANSVRDTEGVYRKYNEKTKEYEELKTVFDALKISNEREIENLKRTLDAERDEKQGVLIDIKNEKEKWQRIIHQKQEDFNREREILTADLKSLKLRQEELERALREKTEESRSEIRKLVSDFEIKEQQLIDEFKEREKEFVIKKSELEEELNKTEQELNYVKRNQDFRETEVRRQVSGEYENRIYQLKLDTALSKSELEWLKEKLDSERERWQSDLADKNYENKAVKEEVSKKINLLESEYNEKLQQLNNQRQILEHEKEEYRKSTDSIRKSGQQKIDELYSEMQLQRDSYESKIKDIRKQYFELNRESARLRQKLELQIDDLKIKLQNQNEENKDIKEQYAKAQKQHEELNRNNEINKKEYMAQMQAISKELEQADGKIEEKIRYIRNKAEEEKRALETRFVQAEKGLRLQIEEKRQRLIVRENELKNLKVQLDDIKGKHESELKAASNNIETLQEKERFLKAKIEELNDQIHDFDRRIFEANFRADTISKRSEGEIVRLSEELKISSEKLSEWQHKEAGLKNMVEEMSQKLQQSERRALELSLKAQAVNTNSLTQMNNSKDEIERINRNHQMEKAILEDAMQRLNQEMQSLKEGGYALQQTIRNKEEQIEKISRSLEDVRSQSQIQLNQKQSEIDRLLEQFSQQQELWRTKIDEKERVVTAEYQNKLEEKDRRWQESYSIREKELLQYKNKIQEELEEIKREKLSSDRMWDVRLKDKEEELKEIQLEKAQNESRLITERTKLQSAINELRSRYGNARAVLKDREEQNRELRARMAQRDIQWKTAYKNKQLEVKRLTFELLQSRRGLLSRVVNSVSGADKRKRQEFNIEIEKDRHTPGIIK